MTCRSGPRMPLTSHFHSLITSPCTFHCTTLPRVFAFHSSYSQAKRATFHQADLFSQNSFGLPASPDRFYTSSGITGTPQQPSRLHSTSDYLLAPPPTGGGGTIFNPYLVYMSVRTPVCVVLLLAIPLLTTELLGLLDTFFIEIILP